MSCLIASTDDDGDDEEDISCMEDTIDRCPFGAGMRNMKCILMLCQWIDRTTPFMTVDNK